jgi:hypothetical protein
MQMKPIDILSLGPKREAVFRKTLGTWLVTVTPPEWSEFKASAVTLTNDQYTRYLDWNGGGKLIQDCLPDLSPSQREILMSGIGDEEFDSLRSEDD